jgi:hypothetical protein
LLSRSDTIIRLIQIRQKFNEREKKLNKEPDDFQVELKQQLDELLIDITGVPETGQHKIHQILEKAISGQIKEKTAVVAIHEIYRDYQKLDKSSENKQINKKKKTNTDYEKKQIDNSNPQNMEKLYQNGYR